jgi:transcriptional regulator of aromatic amino acid metabolism
MSETARIKEELLTQLNVIRTVNSVKNVTCIPINREIDRLERLINQYIRG